jgi:hypothetical protein
MWLKIKQESSGWPAWVKSNEYKMKYVKLYFEKEGIELDASKIEKNDALRFIAKIMLNSFWGKLAQRPNLPQTQVVKDYDTMMGLFTDPQKYVSEAINVDDDTMLITWEYKDDAMAKQSNTNIAVAAFVTAYARLELYKLMERIEEQSPRSLLYHDTDSVLHLQKYCEPEIECGDFLGELTDELKDYGPGAQCKKFVSFGPKTYAYEITKADGSTEATFKVKGLKLNTVAMDIISMRSMMETALAYTKGETRTLQIPQIEIRSDNHHNVYTRYFDKMFRPTADKRVISADCTLPFGYQEL